MVDNLRAVSQKNEYALDKNRFYELKHFCLQYRRWKENLVYLDGYSGISTRISCQPRHDGRNADQTGRTVEARDYYTNSIAVVEDAARQTDSGLARYILTGVTTGLSYDHLRCNYGIPCCRKVYYQMYRRFFWILDKLRK